MVLFLSLFERRAGESLLWGDYPVSLSGYGADRVETLHYQLKTRIFVRTERGRCGGHKRYIIHLLVFHKNHGTTNAYVVTSIFCASRVLGVEKAISLFL
jgi:hypothetical protein